MFCHGVISHSREKVVFAQYSFIPISTVLKMPNRLTSQPVCVHLLFPTFFLAIKWKAMWLSSMKSAARESASSSKQPLQSRRDCCPCRIPCRTFRWTRHQVSTSDQLVGECRVGKSPASRRNSHALKSANKILECIYFRVWIDESADVKLAKGREKAEWCHVLAWYSPLPPMWSHFH